MYKKRQKCKEVVEIEDGNSILEIYGKRFVPYKLEGKKFSPYTPSRRPAGTRLLVFDVRAARLMDVAKVFDTRRTRKYYYDWGEIDRLIYKYFKSKNEYRLKMGMYIEVKDMPDEIINIRNDIMEMLYNLIKTIIYTYSFYQQLEDVDLFQDSAIKLMVLLDEDKHDPVRGTSFTLFTIAIKHMIFTQLKKQKIHISILDSIFPHGGKDDGYTDDSGADEYKELSFD